jgi:peptidoglycan L-alanyl-D-glutamate endopeptidase CwlK
MVKKGQAVNENTQLGIIGNSGRSTARHLHFEVQTSSSSANRIDPTPYLSKAIYTPAPPTPSGNATIKYIQGTLNQRYNTGLNCDGYYGPLTKKGLVKGLQHELNVQYGARLNEDGIFGPATKNACPVVRKGARGNITWLIQAMLYCKGYSTNGIDGIFGSGTSNAVYRFQQNNGLVKDSIVGKNTFEKLFR